MQDQHYVNAGTIRWIMDIRDEGGTVVLDDGSQWKLDEAARKAEIDWKKTMLVMIEGLGTSTAGYMLSASDDRRIPVEYLGLASWSDESGQAV